MSYKVTTGVPGMPIFQGRRDSLEDAMQVVVVMVRNHPDSQTKIERWDESEREHHVILKYTPK